MKYYIAAILAMFFWSSSFIATRIAYTSFGPILLCLVRFIVAWILLVLIQGIQKQRPPIQKEDRKPLFWSAVLGIACYYALENTALSLTSAASVSLLEASYPALTALVGLIFYHQRSSFRTLAGIAVSIVGVVILTGDFPGSNSLIGLLLLIIAGILWGFYNYMVASCANRYDSLTITSYQIGIATLAFIPMSALEHAPVHSLSIPAILSVLYLAAASTIAALLLYNYALKGLSSTAASVLLNLTPVFGVLLSVTVLKESVNLQQIIGGIIILAGVLLSSL